MSKSPAVWPGHVLVGQITAPHGIDGTFRVYPTTDFPERWRQWQSVVIDRLGGSRAVIQSRLTPTMVLLKVEGIQTRDAAEALRGALVMVPETALPDLPPGEYYWHQLIGLTVVEVGTGRVLGTLAHVLRTGARHDVFEVERPGKKSLLIPALKDVVKHVSLAEGRMDVALLPGLEDVAD
ncbi:16S rRNA processing protein RimM [Sulfobacillus acidophilus TPY]|uniref:Ribosome maturation factor RimM n=1 Tax=Sulfobacillus acidophilus (strain ATCC 700253 / DSM 10332 / NAL) TaxID=679936 RepID=G8TVG4_SULAD|nr:16S rRNA processing protein RimM [Sulfobacillus acidophilus TPY]AEW05883.1 16S rRNA processing protein RimM [Sulfobacillus acidophilus DSM 10332]